MATSFRSCLSNNTSLRNGGKCSFLRSKTDLQLLHRSPNKKRNFIVANIATPEAAADLVSSSDLLSSFSLPAVQGISDNPWVAGIAGLMVGVPFLIQWLVTVSKEVGVVAETVEEIADAVGKVDRAAEDLAESLPEGRLKQIVSFVEDLAEETAKDAQMVEELMDKVEELDEKLEKILEKESKKGIEKE
ncbi:hypothetical protein SASPL_143137 [Salvia splendens]|uniref:Uncharacterized protein n=1 Tax=Salvia splendens TaxID=180675 RepID=A0A8X8WN93_SALSN|nr:uncharacterized protein LOC121770734 [Salvia splendens]KAG6396976.1 hypothetical protein SASPL_143137 [Salvia splendens]